jgi:GNAT superfamily N-acetyltransferase
MADTDILFRPITPQDYSAVSGFIKGLYQDDPGEPMTDAKIAATFREFTVRPEKGFIIVFEKEGTLVGYAILVNFWSNEFGGNVLYIDELFVDANHRGQGIATSFIGYLMANHSTSHVALELEVTPRNDRARTLYERLGFAMFKNQRMFRTF